ncbi:curli production assembly protein CsgG [Rhizobiaceae bacterium]|nr:curli production assembly protein CsgG [Rhizobiaceae bacterium]
MAALILASGCTATLPGGLQDLKVQSPILEQRSRIGLALSEIPPPKTKVDVAVYAYEDKTGQQRPQDVGSSFSKAVTQGGEAILVDVLKDTGHGNWFNVVERSSVANLLNERNIIDQSRRSYLNEQRSALPPLRFAGLLMEGGIINYDSNVDTGGAGARYLGIGPSLQYRRDIVTVALRAVSVSSGDVVASVTTTKTIYSTLLRASAFKFVAVDELLELEAGVSRNEPVGLAVRQAIELAVYSLLVKGAKDGIWSFKDHALQADLIDRYDNRYAAPRIANTELIVAAAATKRERNQP